MNEHEHEDDAGLRRPTVRCRGARAAGCSMSSTGIDQRVKDLRSGESQALTDIRERIHGIVAFRIIQTVNPESQHI